VGPRKRKAQKAQVGLLTSSPFKRQLEEIKQKKLDIEQARSTRLEKKDQQKNQIEKSEKKSAKKQQKPAKNRQTRTEGTWRQSAATVADRPTEQ